jgi:hypothetical protein
MEDLVKEYYGNPKAKSVVKVANGGGGPTGVIRALAEGWFATLPKELQEEVSVGNIDHQFTD